MWEQGVTGSHSTCTKKLAFQVLDKGRQFYSKSLLLGAPEAEAARQLTSFLENWSVYKQLYSIWLELLDGMRSYLVNFVAAWLIDSDRDTLLILISAYEDLHGWSGKKGLTLKI